MYSHNTNGNYGWPTSNSNALTWVPCSSSSSLPRGAVNVGNDKNGQPLYAGRAFYQGDLLPAKINPTHSAAYVCRGGFERAVNNYEVLCNADVAWQSVSTQGYIRIPHNAVVVGHTANGENLYMGRAFHEGTLTPGRIQPYHSSLYIPYNGREVSKSNFEIMVLQ